MKHRLPTLVLFFISFLLFRVILTEDTNHKVSINEVKDLFQKEPRQAGTKHHTETNLGTRKIISIRELPINSESKELLTELLKDANPMIRREALLRLRPILSELPENERLEILNKAGPLTIQLANLTEKEIFGVFYAR